MKSKTVYPLGRHLTQTEVTGVPQESLRLMNDGGRWLEEEGRRALLKENQL
jgi:hypothetical protein